MNITCSALPEALLESELFGHERGAFTDARQQKRRGCSSSADGGTVFLDEIGEMAPALQAKLLRFLEEKAFKRVGGRRDIRVDVRVIAATNRDLEEEVASGPLPRGPLLPAERAADPAPAAARAARRRSRCWSRSSSTSSTASSASSPGLSPGRHAAPGHGWPGNIRELRNAVERAMLLAEATRSASGLACPPAGAPTCGLSAAAGGRRPRAARTRLVVQALDGRRHQTRAAALLGMNRDQIRYRIEKFGLKKPATAESKPE